MKENEEREVERKRDQEMAGLARDWRRYSGRMIRGRTLRMIGNDRLQFKKFNGKGWWLEYQ
jgi:hypothetical protein